MDKQDKAAIYGQFKEVMDLFSFAENGISSSFRIKSEKFRDKFVTIYHGRSWTASSTLLPLTWAYIASVVLMSL